MLKKKKMISLLVTTMVLVSAFSFSAYGASVSKTLQAWYGTSKIIIDGEDVTTAIEPFIVDGTTYIPLRVVANAFNKKVDWNPLTATANITDDLTQVDNYYQTEILKRDVEIMNLESRIRQLEKEVEEEKDKEITLKDLEKELNKEFDEYRDIEFDITLKGKTSDVEVRIDVDLYDFDKEWRALTESRKTTYLQDIVDEILDAYPKADVEGYIRDTDAKKTVLEFTIDKKGKVDIESKSSKNTLGDLEEDFNDYYYNHFRSEGIYFYIELEENKNDVTFYVDLDDKTSRNNWDKLSSSKKSSFMRDIYDDLEYEFSKKDVYGFVFYGSEKLYEY